MEKVSVTDLFLYPIKSCAGISVDSWPVAETGLELDREFMLVDADNRFLTQRKEPSLARIQLAVHPNTLFVAAEDKGAIHIDRDYYADSEPVETVVHKKPCTGLDQGSEAAQFFSDYLKKDVRLLRASRENLRYVQEPYQREKTVNRVAFGDGFPFLLTSRASLHELHRRYEANYGTVPMNRFRPNIVIDGPELAPFAEDSWKQISIGKMSAFIVRACDRCQIPSIIQDGTEAGEPGEIAVKADFLRSRAGIDLADPDRAKGRFFGQNLLHVLGDKPLVLKINDLVTVQSEGLSNIEVKVT